jgi:hypothetical protein
MARYIEISLTKRQVSCVAVLLEDRAPRTCAVVWDALPQESDVFHGKYARNEIYTLVRRFGDDPGRENPTITPIPGDVVYFGFEQWQLRTSSHGYARTDEAHRHEHLVDLALFYERNNLLLNPDFGWVPGNVFGTIVEGLSEMAEACQDLWRAGALGETLRFSRVD